jgi:hypothetical protein
VLRSVSSFSFLEFPAQLIIVFHYRKCYLVSSTLDLSFIGGAVCIVLCHSEVALSRDVT